jgi:hypothetical protein
MPTVNFDIRTISILSTVFRPYLIAILILTWAFDIWQQGLLQRNGSARHWRRYGAVIGVTYFLASKNYWSLAFVFTAFAITWSRLPDNPSNDTAASLPNFDKFLRSLPNATAAPSPPPTSEASEAEPNAPSEEPDCIVCWSSSTPPKVLPCSHLICADCLTGIRSSTQNHCPMCRLPLFTRSNTRTIAFYRAIACVWNADITARLLTLSLHVYKGEIWTRDVLFDVVWVSWEAFYTLWMRRMIREGGEEWWRSITFSRLDGATVWRRADLGLVLVGCTLAFKVWEVRGLDVDYVVVEV